MSLQSKKYDNMLQPVKTFDSKDILLLKNTVAKDLNTNEFNLFCEVAKRVGLDPFRRQIYAHLFHKNKADKRQMVIITGIDGLRAIAQRSGRYRPDDDEPQYFYNQDLKDQLNPLGIERCVVKVYYCDDGGDWHNIKGVAYWDEFRKVDVDYKTNKTELGSMWKKMGRVMIAKCAEAQALRKGWPEETGSIYTEDELGNALASDVVESQMEEDRIRRSGASGDIALQLDYNLPLEMVNIGEFHDKICGHIDKLNDIEALERFQSINQISLKLYWGKKPNDALELKKFIEKKSAKLKAARDAERVG